MSHLGVHLDLIIGNILHPHRAAVIKVLWARIPVPSVLLGEGQTEWNIGWSAALAQAHSSERLLMVSGLSCKKHLMRI